MNPRFRRIPGLVALVLAGAYAGATLLTAPGDGAFGSDSSAYLAAADRLVAGEPLYPATTPDGLTPIGQDAYFYPPLVAAAFLPLAQLPPGTAKLAWFAVLIALAAVVGAWLVRAIAPANRAWALAAYLAYLPLLSELRYGNLNLLTLALCLAAWACRERAPLAGALLAAAVGIKLLPLALIVFLVALGRRRMVAWAVAIGAAVVVLSWPWLGGAWHDYVGVLRAIGIGAPAAGSNIVPGLFVDPPWRYLLPVVGLAVAAAAGLLARRRGGDERAFTTALAAAPLLATTVWYPYLVLALPAVLGSAGDRGIPDRAGTPLTRVTAWLAIQAQLLAVAKAYFLPLAGLLVVTAAGLRDSLRRAPGGDGSGHILAWRRGRPRDAWQAGQDASRPADAIAGPDLVP
jgi:hypothetical protein